MTNTKSKLTTSLLLLAMFAFSPLAADAQLPRDVQDMFEGMLDDLDKDLRLKFKKAIEDDTATVEFTPEEFLRFREDPVNPFEGLDRIEVSEGGGNIALRFELPSIRNRTLKLFERQAPENLSKFAPIVKSLIPSVVAVMSDNRQIALGTVVDTNGFVVTKASEVNKKKYLKIVTADAKEHEAKLVYENKANDIGILKVGSSLNPINWLPVNADPGQFVLLPAPNGKVFSMGTFSAIARSTKTGTRAQLGVNPDEAELGVLVSEIMPNTAAFNAGLVDGDIITRIDKRPIRDVSQLVNAIRKKDPGDTIAIEFLRDNMQKRTEAILDSISLSGERAKRYKMMSRLGAIPSRRSDNFPFVFQHDAPLFPEQCGGPVVDLDGNIIGINIARNGRAATYAIPLENVQRLFSEFLRESVAARD